MTVESLETYRGRMTRNEFQVAEMLVTGCGINDTIEALHIGNKRFYALVQVVEAMVGERLRGQRGHKLKGGA